MNRMLVALLVMFCVVLLKDTHAWRIRVRGRRIWNRIKKPVCSVLCTYTCKAATGGLGAPVCGFGCRNVCGRRRRSASQLSEEETSTGMILLPRNIALYDTNKDGFIQQEEFADFLDVDPSHADVKMAFSLADSDGDSLISEAEFEEAPWAFEQVDEDSSEESNKDDEE